MPDNGKLIIKIDANATDFEKEVRKAIETAAKLSAQYGTQYQKSLKANAELLKSVNGAAVTAAGLIATAGAAVLSCGINYNAQMEQYKASFTTMLGDADKAEAKLSELRAMAEKTPFELTDLAQASTTLLAFGEDVDSLMPDLQMLGDISLGNQEKFKGLALVFGQVKSQGKLMGQDLLQMINQGFNPLQVISEKTGESMTSLKDKMSKGQISFEMVADAMKTATSAGGQFYKAMENQSKTLTGQWSTLKDNIASLTGEITSGISKTLTEDVLPKAIAKTKELKAAWADGSLQKSLGTAASVATTFGVALLGWNAAVVIGDLTAIIKGVKNHTIATKAGAAAQNLLNAKILANPYALATTAVLALAAGIVVYKNTHKSASEKIIDSLEDIRKSHDETIESIEKTKNEQIAEASAALSLKNRLFELEEQIKSGKLEQTEATAAHEEFNAVANSLGEILPEITSYLYDETGAINIQSTAVNNLTQSYYDLAVAKATAAAAEEKMTEIGKSLVNAKIQQKKAQEDANAMSDQYRSSTSIIGAFKMASANKALEKATKDVEQYENEIVEVSKIAKDAAKSIATLTKGTEKEVEAGTDKIINRVSSANSSNTKSTKKATDEQKKLIKEKYDYEVKQLDHARDLCVISDEEYYQGLAEARNKYLDESDEEWQEATHRIQKYYADMLENAKQKAIDSIEELKKVKEQIAKNIKPDNTSYTKTTISYRMPGYDAVESYNKFELADFASSNEKHAEYNRLIKEMFDTKGTIPQQIIEELRNMDVQEGAEFVRTILSTSDDEWKKHISEMLESEQLANQTSDLLVDNEFKQLKSDLEEEFGELPEGFFDIGEDSAEMFGKGLMAKLHIILENAKAEVESVLSSVGDGSYTVVTTGGGGSTYYDNRSTTMNVTASTPRGFYEEVKSYNTYEKHTSKWG